ncbi:MAG TPA: hypothetical protein VGQ54_03295 [Burkholderiales bacterium]|nr:hypothetical protein [Burkholderiales bacterium]
MAALTFRQRRWRSAWSRSSPLAREITWVLILKFLLLWMIWWAFFSDPPARHMQLELSQVEHRLLIPASPAEPAHAER